MIRLCADENFNNTIVRGVRRRNERVDIITIQDVGLSGANDEAVLQWAAEENRVLLTHDVTTLTKYAYARIEVGLPVPGVFEVSQSLPLGRVIEDIVLLAECSLENEWAGQVRYLPL